MVDVPCTCLNYTIVSTSEVAVVERFGKFSRLVEAGPSCLCCEYVAGKVSLRVQQLSIEFDTKTKDNVFVNVSASIQYQAIQQNVYQAFYKLQNHEEQMKAYVYDVIRAAVSGMTLDQSFESKLEIAHSLQTHLQEVFSLYGFLIVNALVTDLSPAVRVRDAMNEINASKRLKEAAYQRAEGDKILKVKRAEAEAESMYLSGVGVARQRKAILDGLRDSIVDFSAEISGTSAKDIMDLLVLNQYFDTIQEVGSHKNTKIVFLGSERNNVRDGVLEADTLKK